MASVWIASSRPIERGATLANGSRANGHGRRGHSHLIYLLPPWARPALVLLTMDWLEGIAHLLTAYGLSQGVKEIWAQRRDLMLADVDLGKPGSGRPVATPLVGWFASVTAGGLLLLFHGPVLLVLGVATGIRAVADLLLIPFVKDHEMAPVIKSMSRVAEAA